jgi:tRNA-Thr(GGU) m(6)t(6)A37 methyltransferase TsaA
MRESFSIFPIGVVRKQNEAIWIDLLEVHSDGLLGLDGFSHINVLFWFHENDNSEKRAVLQVHPRREKQNPLTGVFATHSPARPNLIGLTRCEILSITGNRIVIDDIDALDGTPVIDIKCYIPHSVAGGDVRVPDWV